jgi:hypothetical protein
LSIDRPIIALRRRCISMFAGPGPGAFAMSGTMRSDDESVTAARITSSYPGRVATSGGTSLTVCSNEYEIGSTRSRQAPSGWSQSKVSRQARSAPARWSRSSAARAGNESGPVGPARPALRPRIPLDWNDESMSSTFE